MYIYLQKNAILDLHSLYHFFFVHSRAYRCSCNNNYAGCITGAWTEGEGEGGDYCIEGILCMRIGSTWSEARNFYLINLHTQLAVYIILHIQTQHYNNWYVLPLQGCQVIRGGSRINQRKGGLALTDQTSTSSITIMLI